MRHAAIVVAFVLTAAPAYAQLGKLIDAKRKADNLRELVITEADERKIGEMVSALVIADYGVFQDKAVTKYVTLLGTVLAKESKRPDLKWEFIVLDTDGINAFAAPGGLVHITRGALGLIKSEAELAGVLAHEISHVAKRHTANSIEKNKRIGMATDIAAGSNAYFDFLADAVYDNIVEKGFDLADESDADQEGVRLANKVGYNPSGLNTFLTKLMERNSGAKPARNGLFASHPETQGRIKKLDEQIKKEKLTGTGIVQARYASTIRFDAKPLSEVATVARGTRGVASSGAEPKPGEKPPEEKPEEKKEEPKKRGFGLGSLKLSSGNQAESTQASASAGGRAVGPDRGAAGGPNKSKLALPAITPAELEAFKKGIAG